MINHIKAHLVGYLTLLLLLLASTAYAGHAQRASAEPPDPPAGAVAPGVAPPASQTPAELAPAAVAGCQNGNVRGYARVKAHGGMGQDWSSAISAIDRVYNCSGGKVEVRRQSQGHFYVRFLGNNSRMALGISNSDAEDTNSKQDDDVISIKRMTSGSDTGAFRIEVEDINGGGTASEDAWFNLVLF